MAKKNFRFEKVPTEVLVNWPVHPLAEAFPMESLDNRKLLGEDMQSQGQQMPVLANNGVIFDGRNRISAGFMFDLDLRVKHYTDLTDSQIDEMIQSLNVKRRDLPRDVRIGFALEYYQKENAAGRKTSYEKAAARYNVAPRTLFRRLSQASGKARPGTTRPSTASQDRIPHQFRDMLIALSSLHVLRNTEEGRRELRGFSARIKSLSREILSRPELEGAIELCPYNFDHLKPDQNG